MRIEIRSINDETRKSNAHGFDRSVRWDKTKQLRIFPTTPKMKIIGDKYRLSCSEVNFNDWISSSLSVVDIMIKN